MHHRTSVRFSLIGFVGCAALAASAGGQTMKAPTTSGEGQGLQIVELETISEAHRQANLRRSDAEVEMKRLRAKYFRGIRNPEIRQIGIVKMREYTDPALYPSLMEIFAREGDDVRDAVLDHLRDQRNDQADATLAWTAVFDKKDVMRGAATERLIERTEEAGETSYRVKSVVAEGLRRERNYQVAGAAQLAQQLKLFEAIPMLINAQVQGAPRGESEDGDGALAWILVGRQQTFISDLQPVVGDSAVGFDPELSVITEGVILRVVDAAVYTYRVEVHNALVDLSSEAWGQPTKKLGWDQRAWRDWYTDEFVPYLAEKKALAEGEMGEGSGPG